MVDSAVKSFDRTVTIYVDLREYPEVTIDRTLRSQDLDVVMGFVLAHAILCYEDQSKWQEPSKLVTAEGVVQVRGVTLR